MQGLLWHVWRKSMEVLVRSVPHLCSISINRCIYRDVEPRLKLRERSTYGQRLESLSNLDAKLRVSTRAQIKNLSHELQVTTIYVTHDQVEAMTMADKIVVMHDGIIEQTGTPLELYNKPSNLFVAGFIGSPKMNFMTGKIATDKGADVCGIRPEHISLSEIKGDFSGIVRHVEMLGADTLFHIETADYGMMVISQPTVSSNLGGINIYLTLQSDYLHFFKDDVRLETGAD